MGKLLNKKIDYINRCIDTRQKLDLNQYNKFLDNAPIPVTYYHQSEVNTTTDNGLDNTNDFLGDESSIRYNKIEELPLYSVNQSLIDMNDDESGLRPGFSSEAILLPGMFVPVANDMIKINYMEKNVLFRVNEVVPGTIKSNDYFKISFKFYKYMDDECEIEKQVTDNFISIFENIGTNNKCLLEKDVYKKVEKLLKLHEVLKNEYIDIFYENKYNSFLCNYSINGECRTFYNKFLTHFIITNNILKTSDNTFDDLFLDIEVNKGKNFMVDYKNSIFYAIEKNDKNMIKNSHIFMFPVSATTQNCIFFNRYEKVYDFLLYNNEIAFFTKPMIDEDILKSFYDDKIINTNVTDKKDCLILFIFNYLNGSAINDELIEKLIDAPLYYEHNLYLLTPISLYIIKNILNNLIIK